MTLTEGRRAGEALISEAPGSYSREKITVASGQDLEACTVLGKVLLGAASGSSSAVTGTGNGTISGVAVTSAAKIGAYVVKCTAAAANGGTFSVTDPDGVVIGSATVGQAFSAQGLTLTVNDGATDYVVGDYFTVTVVAASVAAAAGNTGNGTVGSITISAGAKAGNYRLMAIEPGTNVGTFLVEDPDGNVIGRATVAVAFSAAGVAFTIADGSTDFVAGDSFILTVKAGSGQYRAVNPDALDGSQTAAAILFDAVDASTGSQPAAALVRACEVNQGKLDFGSMDAGEIATAITQLAAVGIIVRASLG